MTTQQHPEDFVVNEPLILIFIGGTIGEDLSLVHPADVYAAVHGRWRYVPTDERQEQYRLILARNSNRVLGAFRPRLWFFDENVGRYYFYGDQAEMSVQLDYVGKRVPNRFRVQSPFYMLNPGN